MTEYRIVNNENQWQQLDGPAAANRALDLGYNVLITDPPTPGGTVVTPASGRRFDYMLAALDASDTKADAQASLDRRKS